MKNKINEVLRNLKRNNMKGYHIESEGQLYQLLNELITEGETLGCGDSMTLEELGVFDYIRQRNVTFYDKYK